MSKQLTNIVRDKLSKVPTSQGGVKMTSPRDTLSTFKAVVDKSYVSKFNLSTQPLTSRRSDSKTKNGK